MARAVAVRAEGAWREAVPGDDLEAETTVRRVRLLNGTLLVVVVLLALGLAAGGWYDTDEL